MKKRLLIVNEFSQLNTGFSTYMYYILPLLHKTGKYEIAELGTYVYPGHPKLESQKVPWKVYPNEPSPDDEKQRDVFSRSRDNQFGKWSFEDVCLDFQPDIVISIADSWMCSFIMTSPYRPYYKWLYMPTVDGLPQKDDWVEQYINADAVLTYSRWAFENLQRISNKINLIDVASPGADVNIFKYVSPEEKKVLKREFGLSPDTNIIQTVMRNQPRKLYPDLFKAFNKFLKKCKEKGYDELANKTLLYVHSSYPDVGWDFADELRSHSLNNKVLFSYTCDSCGLIFPSFFAGERTFCFKCKNHTARMPNTGFGISRESLAKIMGCADLYIQYSTCLAKDQKIITNRGIIPIQDIKENDLVYTHKNRWKKVIEPRFIENNIGYACKLELSNVVDNEIIGHPNHRVLGLIDNEIKEIELSNLKPGDRIISNIHNIDSLSLEKQKNILQNLCKGKGYWDNTEKVTIVNVESKILARQIENILRQLYIDYSCTYNLNSDHYEFRIKSNIESNEFIKYINNNNNISNYYDDKFLIEVKSNKQIEYNDYWYNFEVEEDHTYNTVSNVNFQSEGFGMPVNDAKAVGVPTFVVDSSAMMDHARSGGGKAIPVQRFFKESINQTGQLRAYPDNDTLADYIIEFFLQDESERVKMGLEARKCIEENYNWENIAKIWERAIDNLEVPDHKETWLSDIKQHTPNMNIPDIPSHEDFVFWCYANILGEPEQFNTYFAQRCISYLNSGYEPIIIEDGKPSKSPFDRQKFLNYITGLVKHKNQLESIRYKRLVDKESARQHYEVLFSRI